MVVVREIHNSKLFGIIVETGCGTACSSLLLNEPGASKTVYYALQPYNKEFEHKRYGQFDRSVSKEFCAKAIEVERLANIDSDINFILTSSWQIGDSLSITHGWIGIWYKETNKKYFYHFTFNKSTLNRTGVIDNIGRIGVTILHQLIGFDFLKRVDLDGVSAIATVDQIYYQQGSAETEFYADNKEMVRLLELATTDYPLVFTKDGSMRFEKLMRESEEFIVQKGSFNPLHHMHVKMIKSALQLYPNAKPVFLISTYVYDKPHIDKDELMSRIENITQHGYPVIICKEIFFYNTFKLFRRWTLTSKKFYFPMGTDTINRIYQADVEQSNKEDRSVLSAFKTKTYIDGMVRIFSPNFRFLVHKRAGYDIEENTSWYGDLMERVDNFVDDGTSSTKIRKGEIQNLLDS